MVIILPSDSDTLRKTQSSLDGFSVGGSHTTDTQHRTQQDQSWLERAIGSTSDGHEAVFVDARVIRANVDSQPRRGM